MISIYSMTGLRRTAVYDTIIRMAASGISERLTRSLVKIHEVNDLECMDYCHRKELMYRYRRGEWNVWDTGSWRGPLGRGSSLIDAVIDHRKKSHKLCR